MTPPRGAEEILSERPQLDFAVERLSQRASEHNGDLPPEEAQRLSEAVRLRSVDLLDEWTKIAAEMKPFQVNRITAIVTRKHPA